MKKFYMLALYIAYQVTAFGQLSTDASRIGFYPLVNPKTVDEGSVANWQSSFESLLSSNGLLNLNESRFICGLNVVTNQVEMTPAGDMYAYNVDIYVSVVDIKTLKKYGVFHIQNVKAAGTNQTKAMKSLASNLKSRFEQKGFNSWVESMKNMILTDYKSNCAILQKEAVSLAKARRFDEAINRLSEIPDVLGDCYFNSQDTIVKIYLDKLNFECQSKLATAKVLISQNQFVEAANMLYDVDPGINCYKDVEQTLKAISKQICSVNLGAAKGAWASLDYELASYYLSQISSNSDCADEAQKLSADVLKYAREKDNREWNFELEKYRNSVSLEKRRIEAARSIGVAYGMNQPREVTKLVAIYPW